MLRYLIGTTFDGVRSLPTHSVDLVLASPPFLAQRSYLPRDHPDKAKEIGQEGSPADFLAALLSLVDECGRVLAPHGSLAFELGDTYARNAPGWPRPKSLALVPELFAASLAYGRNLLRPEQTLEPWIVRNVVVWCRTNPAPKRDWDTYRNATSYVTVATRSTDRYFDMDVARLQRTNGKLMPTGPPLLDWWLVNVGQDRGNGDHFAPWPTEVALRLIEVMCPRRVCTTCGEPSRRVTQRERVTGTSGRYESSGKYGRIQTEDDKQGVDLRGGVFKNRRVLGMGWSDCGCNTWRPGMVLDPFAGSGTSLLVAALQDRDAIGIDLNPMYAAGVEDRCQRPVEVVSL